MNKPLEYTATLNGARDGMVRWLININGQNFDYGEGVGHFIDTYGLIRYKNPKEVYQSWAEKIAHGRAYLNLDERSKPNRKRCPHAKKAMTGAWFNLKPTPPELDSVLYCLVSDAEASDMGFADWCSDFGLGEDAEDSRKALATYLECQDTAAKLRKAGVNIAAERERLADY